MRDAAEISTMEGVEYLASIPKGEEIVAMIELGGDIYVASTKHLYVLRNDKRLEPF